MIKCELVEITEYSSIPSKKKRRARYSNSCFWDIKGFGKDKWVVVAYINPDDSWLLIDEPDVQEIAEGRHAVDHRTFHQLRGAAALADRSTGRVMDLQRGCLLCMLDY